MPDSNGQVAIDDAAENCVSVVVMHRRSGTYRTLCADPTLRSLPPGGYLPSSWGLRLGVVAATHRTVVVGGVSSRWICMELAPAIWVCGIDAAHGVRAVAWGVVRR